MQIVLVFKSATWKKEHATQFPYGSVFCMNKRVRLNDCTTFFLLSIQWIVCYKHNSINESLRSKPFALWIAWKCVSSKTICVQVQHMSKHQPRASLSCLRARLIPINRSSALVHIYSTHSFSIRPSFTGSYVMFLCTHWFWFVRRAT